jgi:aspartyl-tRNA(Asn)/glutamyl-tRNA(Gln) amidotransferase subunit A
VCAERALASAAAAERRWAAGGDPTRPLDGIPYALKDIIATAGVRTTGGSSIYGDWIPSESAALHERLEAAGGVLVAKLQTFAFAFGHEINTAFGEMRNPWDLARTAGGSSSGSGAALAAREVPLAVGTDTGGSIRIPAAFCGVTGLKPTFGRVPRHGVMPLAWTLDHAGPMARSVEDTARMLNVMAGKDQRDPTSAPAPVDDYLAALGGGVDGLRIGRPVDWFFDVVDPDVAAATDAAFTALASAGAKIVDVRLPQTHLAEAIGWIILFAEMASLHGVTFPRLDEYDLGFAERLVNAQFVSASDYLRCLRLRPLVQADYEAALDQVDALLMPAAPSSAPAFDGMMCRVGDEERSWLEICARNTFPFNVTGMPALVLPAGLDRFGLPVAIQVAARPYDESTCLRIGHVFQQLTDHHLAVPSVLETVST